MTIEAYIARDKGGSLCASFPLLNASNLGDVSIRCTGLLRPEEGQCI